MRKLFFTFVFTFVVGVIFFCGLIIGMRVGEKMYVLKKVGQVKGVAHAAVELPIKVLPKIIIFPLQVTAEVGGKVLHEIKKAVEYPLVFLKK